MTSIATGDNTFTPGFTSKPKLNLRDRIRQKFAKLKGKKIKTDMVMATCYSRDDWSGPYTGPHGGRYYVNSATGRRSYSEHSGGDDDAPAEDSTQEHRFASTQFNLPPDVAAKVRRIAAMIPAAILADDGRETEPHVTLKYGLHSDDPQQVARAIHGAPPITVTLGKTSIFPASEAGGYDVVKIDVDSPQLHALNKRISSVCRNTDTHPTYKPHVTLAYVKAGQGKRFAGKEIPGLTGKQIQLDTVLFSDRNRKRTRIPLTGQRQQPQTYARALVEQYAFQFQGPRSGRERTVPTKSDIPKSVMQSGAYQEVHANATEKKVKESTDYKHIKHRGQRVDSHEAVQKIHDRLQSMKWETLRHYAYGLDIKGKSRNQIAEKVRALLLLKATEKAAKKEKLKGGKADGKPDSEFAADALKQGMKVEAEHTSDPSKAREIAKDHLAEDPKYYDKLKKMEAGKPRPSSQSSTGSERMAALRKEAEKAAQEKPVDPKAEAKAKAAAKRAQASATRKEMNAKRLTSLEALKAKMRAAKAKIATATTPQAAERAEKAADKVAGTLAQKLAEHVAAKPTEQSYADEVYKGVTPQEMAADGGQRVWALRDKATGKLMMETRQASVVNKLNRDKYEAVPMIHHLKGLNKPPTQTGTIVPKTEGGTAWSDKTRAQFAKDLTAKHGIDSGSANLLRMAVEKVAVDPDHVMKVAKGAAKVDGAAGVESRHIAEAIQYVQQGDKPQSEWVEKRKNEVLKASEPTPTVDTNNVQKSGQTAPPKVSGPIATSRPLKGEMRQVHAPHPYEYNGRQSQAVNHLTYRGHKIAKVMNDVHAVFDENGKQLPGFAKSPIHAAGMIDRRVDEPAEAKPATLGEKLRSKLGIQDFGEKIGGARKDMAKPLGPRAAKVATDAPAAPAESVPSWRRPYKIVQDSGTGKHFIAKGRNIVYAGGRRADFDSKEEAEQHLTNHVLNQTHRVRDVSRKGEEPNYAIVRHVTKNKAPTVKGGFKTREEAEAHMKANPHEILNHKFPNYEDYQYLARVERTGPEHRQGDVKPAHFHKAFNFRGGEFGNWQMDRSGQEALNHGHDALHDLANTLGIPSEAVALNGKLAIGFGARGTGGKNAARAHYEPDKKVINLTKMKGAGSLGHEWMHALDHHLAEAAGAKGSTVADGLPYNHKLPKELSDAWKGVKDSIHTTDVTSDLKADTEAKMADYAKNTVKQHLDSIEQGLQPSTYRKVKPFTPEQRKEWDGLKEKILNGDIGEKMFVEGQSRLGGYETHANIKRMNELYKKATGRSFHTADAKSTGEYLKWAGRRVRDSNARLAEAHKGGTETKKQRSNFYNEAARLDSTRVGDYYTKPQELAARAFEAYIMDKMGGEGRKNDYLGAKANNAFYAHVDMKPFPEGEERKKINAAFDKFFGAARKHGLFDAGGVKQEQPQPTKPAVHSPTSALRAILDAERVNRPKHQPPTFVPPPKSKTPAQKSGAWDESKSYDFDVHSYSHGFASAMEKFFPGKVKAVGQNQIAVKTQYGGPLAKWIKENRAGHWDRTQGRWIISDAATAPLMKFLRNNPEAYTRRSAPETYGSRLRRMVSCRA